MILNIESCDQPDALQFLEDKLYEYNAQSLGRFDGETFTFVARDETSNIVAGISGWVWASVSEITHLWVDEQYRSHGLGIRLLTAAETEVRSRNAANILLRTYSFQAPQFYQKNGYEIIFMLDNFPAGCKHYTLLKSLESR